MAATPFHFGPGLLIKAAAPRQFSMAAYALTQVVIDIESGYYLLRHDFPVHRDMHTFLVGGLIGVLCGMLVSRTGAWIARPRDLVGEALIAEYQMWTAILSGLFGGLFHAVVDGFMYTDIRPFRPLSSANPLFGLVSVRNIYLFCVITGLLGAVLLLAWERRPRRF
jgi:hypothetical protein